MTIDIIYTDDEVYDVGKECGITAPKMLIQSSNIITPSPSPSGNEFQKKITCALQNKSF